MSTNQHLKNSIATGTLLSVCIGASDFEKTMVLAVVGTVVSFSLSLLLRWLSRKIKEWFDR